MQIKCKKAVKYLAPYIDNEVLKLRQRRKIKEHLEICLHCQELEKDFKKILGLRGKFKPMPIPADLLEKIKEKIRNTPVSESFLKRLFKKSIV